MKLSPQFARAALRTVWIFCAAFPAAFAAPPSAPPRAEPPSILESAGAANQSRGMSTVGLTTSMEVLNDKTKLGIGDHVSFRIVEDRHEPIRLFVTDSGEMEIPLIGRVEARGKTCKQLAYEIKPLFEKEYFKKATVIIGLDLVSTKPLGKVFITGQVRSGGLMELMPGEPVTVSQAILRAGGVGDFADKRKIRLVRKKDGVAAMTPEALKALQAKKPGFFKSMFTKNKESATDSTVTYLVDLVEILEKGHLERDPELKVGDLIFVPERLINF